MKEVQEYLDRTLSGLKKDSPDFADFLKKYRPFFISIVKKLHSITHKDVLDLTQDLLLCLTEANISYSLPLYKYGKSLYESSQETANSIYLHTPRYKKKVDCSFIWVNKDDVTFVKKGKAESFFYNVLRQQYLDIITIFYTRKNGWEVKSCVGRIRELECVCKEVLESSFSQEKFDIFCNLLIDPKGSPEDLASARELINKIGDSSSPEVLRVLKYLLEFPDSSFADIAKGCKVSCSAAGTLKKRLCELAEEVKNPPEVEEVEEKLDLVLTPCVPLVEVLVEQQEQEQEQEQGTPIEPNSQANRVPHPELEKDRVLYLLCSMCSSLFSSDLPPKVGRPKLPLSDIIFSSVLKVYSRVSGRLAVADFLLAKEKGFIEGVPHYNSISRYMEDPDLTAVLKNFIYRSSLPLVQLEDTFVEEESIFYTKILKQSSHIKRRVYNSKINRSVTAKFSCGVNTHIISGVDIVGWSSSMYVGEEEKTISMLKASFGDFLFSKSVVSGFNELLCKVISYNLSLLAHEVSECGLRPNFWFDVSAA